MEVLYYALLAKVCPSAIDLDVNTWHPMA